MESKFYVYLLLLLAFAGGCYALFLNQDTDALNQKLIITRQSATSIQSSIDNFSRQIEQKKEVAVLIQAVEAKKAEKEALEKEITAIQDAEPALADSMKQAISRVRRESVGLDFPELTLASGITLKKAQIQRVEEEEVVFQHAEGVKRASAGDLPPDLKDRLRLGALKAVEDASAPKVAETATTGAPSTGSMAAYEEAKGKHEKKLLDAQLATERMRKDLENLKAQLTQAESDMSAATSATKKFYTKSRRDQVSLQVQAMQSRVDTAEIELKRLEANAPKEPAQ
jgi:predicted  nucleic acid-binding Zn-ribbon protein